MFERDNEDDDEDDGKFDSIQLTDAARLNIAIIHSLTLFMTGSGAKHKTCKRASYEPV